MRLHTRTLVGVALGATLAGQVSATRADPARGHVLVRVGRGQARTAIYAGP